LEKSSSSYEDIVINNKNSDCNSLEEQHFENKEKLRAQSSQSKGQRDEKEREKNECNGGKKVELVDKFVNIPKNSKIQHNSLKELLNWKKNKKSEPMLNNLLINHPYLS